MNYSINRTVRGDDTLPVKELEVGDIALVHSWRGSNSPQPGDVLLRAGGVLVCLNRPDLAWIVGTDILPDCRVRLLARGEQITITGMVG